MERRGRASEVKVCHTCGHTGFADSIATCSLCKVSHEHTYCMSLVRYEVPKEWRCEECLRSGEAVSNSHLPAPQFWHKRTSRKVEAGKVKFITNEEVVTLASANRSHGRGNPTVSGHRGDFACLKPPPIPWKPVAPASPSSKTAAKAPFRPTKVPVYAGVDVSRSEHTKTSKPVGKEKGSETAAQVCKMKTVEGKANSLAYNFSATCTKLNEVRFDIVDSLRADDGQISMVDKHIENITPMKPQDDCLFIEKATNGSLIIKEERDLHKQRVANVLPVNDSGTAVHSMPEFSQNLSRKVSLPLKLVISSDEKHHHAVEACWRGAFEVPDLLTQFRGTFHAHLSCQVSPKVYDISKHLPGTLQFKMLSRESVWPKIFKLSPPTKDDVALYFLCEVERRHEENYAQFIEHIDSRDYALQGCVEDAELLIFTSAQLQIDSQSFGGDIYLWGVFRHLKKNKAILGEEKAVSCSPSMPTAHLTHARSLEVSMEADMWRGSEREVDMEIDMVAGYPIGRIDVPIKLEDAPSGFSKPIQSPSVSSRLKKSTNSHFSSTPPGFPIPTHKRSVTAPPGKPKKNLISSNASRKYSSTEPEGN